MTQKDTF